MQFFIIIVLVHQTLGKLKTPHWKMRAYANENNTVKDICKA
jgi:hypothetical protein